MIRKLISYISAHKLQFAGALILAVGTILAGIGLMSTSGYLISRAAQRPMIVDLFVVTAGVRFFGISRAVVRYFERVVSHDLTFRILLSMRTRFYNQVEAFSQKWLMSKRPGELLSSVTSDIETLQNVYLRIISPVIVAITISIITFGGLAFYDIRLAFVTLAFFIINGTVVPYLAGYLAKGRGKENVDVRTKMKVFLVDRLQGLQDLIWMGRKQQTLAEFNEMQHRLDQIQNKNAGTSGLIEGLNNMMAHTAMFTILVLSIPLVITGEINGLILAALTLGVLSSFEAFQGLANAFVQHEASEEAASRLFSLAKEEVPGYSSIIPAGSSASTSLSVSTGTRGGTSSSPPVPISSRASATLSESISADTSTGNAPDKSAGSHDRASEAISDDGTPAESKAVANSAGSLRMEDPSFKNMSLSFENVSFSYHDNDDVLKNISFSLPAGSKTAIVGPTGSGKSTLVNLLLGFWHPRQGKITAGRDDIHHLDMEKYRNLFGIVSQDAYIFNRSLRENLLLANQEAPDQKLVELLGVVGLTSFANNLDMEPGTQGMRFSGGERQLFAMARALLKKNSIWIFDEPTAHMDAHTERRLLDTLWKVRDKRTFLLITHRLIDMEKMDQIFVMNKGSIAEAGTHSELLERNGFYTRMLDHQMQLIRD
jgi:ABC-type transport system involved in cytochrome bd biosynthesis fused ATPase/permease subunit